MKPTLADQDRKAVQLNGKFNLEFGDFSVLVLESNLGFDARPSFTQSDVTVKKSEGTIAYLILMKTSHLEAL